MIVDSKELRTKKTETDERSFAIGSISLCVCVFDSKIESFEKKKVRKFTKKIETEK